MGPFQNLTKRLLLVVPIIVALTLLVLFSDLLFVKYFILIALLFAVNTALYEYAYLCNAGCGFKKSHYLLILSTVFVIIHFFSRLFLLKVFYFPLIVAFLFVTFLISFSFLQGGINFLSYSMLGLIYIVLPLLFLVDILLFIPDISNRAWFVYILVVAKSSDIGGYFFGKLLGRHAMASKLSPKKTVEGAFFGLIFSVGASLLIKCISDSFELVVFESYSYGALAILGFIVGVLALLGDLSESLIKRDANIKHSNPLSSFGGSLDLIDSLVFCIPFMFFYLEYTR
jgi:phosphatidate cytidylyltransferase